jgi:tellurite resistance protein TerC
MAASSSGVRARDVPAPMSVRRAIRLSIAWLLGALAAGVPLLLLGGNGTAVSYWAVYVLERTLSLDNVFIFLLIVGYFRLTGAHARRLVWWAIAGALVLRAVAILLGAELLERFSAVSYVLGGLLVVFAVRMLRPQREDFDPQSNLIVRVVRRFVPVTTAPDPRHFVTRREGRPAVTPTGIALAAMIAADVTFAVHSIPAPFGITLDALPIWLANAAALLGPTPLLVLVRALVRRFRYMRQTLAAVLALIGVRLLAADIVTIGPLASLAVIVATLGAGVAASLVADRRSPPAPAEEDERRPPRCPPAARASAGGTPMARERAG